MTIKRCANYGGILHEVVEHNDTLYLSGLVAEDLSKDIKRQANDVIDQLEILLNSHGSDIHNVLRAVIYLSDLNLKAGFNTGLVEVAECFEVGVDQRLINERPEMFRWLQFRTVRRLIDQSNTIRDGKVLRPVPAGVVQLKHNALFLAHAD